MEKETRGRKAKTVLDYCEQAIRATMSSLSDNDLQRVIKICDDIKINVTQRRKEHADKEIAMLEARLKELKKLKNE